MSHRYVTIELEREVAADASDKEFGGPVLPRTIHLTCINRLYLAWLLIHIDALRMNGWPHCPDEVITDHSGVPHGPQELPMMYTAEALSRVESCGEDGQFCLAYYRHELSPREIVATFSLPIQQGKHGKDWAESRVCHGINRSLKYSSGFRKSISYQEWYRRPYKSQYKSQLDKQATSSSYCIPRT